MKKVMLLACLCGTFIACNNVEQKADEKLQAARKAFEQGNYNEAKTLIDSIKILYPKAFDTRRAGIALMQEVELKEQERSLTYLDSLLRVKQDELEAIKGQYAFEKNAEYQTIGNYLHPSQVIEKNLHRSYLRFQVNEKGVMSMTSIYCGAQNIHHIAVKVTAPDGTFAETPASKDSYETTDLGEKIEKADYKQGEDGNVISFLYYNKDKNIRVSYQGEQPYSTTMTADDRQALAAIYELSQVLSAITDIQKDIEEANLKAEFIKRKMAEKNQEPA
ncbi:MAG: hypothetical protein Q4D56_06425 [Bacteroides sp.]|nr:hypothetical protein [Bacteroides sp.]